MRYSLMVSQEGVISYEHIYRHTHTYNYKTFLTCFSNFQNTKHMILFITTIFITFKLLHYLSIYPTSASITYLRIYLLLPITPSSLSTYKSIHHYNYIYYDILLFTTIFYISFFFWSTYTNITYLLALSVKHYSYYLN